MQAAKHLRYLTPWPINPDVHLRINPWTDDAVSLSMRRSSSSDAHQAVATQEHEICGRIIPLFGLRNPRCAGSCRRGALVPGCARLRVALGAAGSNGLPILVHLRRALDQDLELMAARAEVLGGANRLGQGITLTFVVEDDLDALAAR